MPPRPGLPRAFGRRRSTPAFPDLTRLVPPGITWAWLQATLLIAVLLLVTGAGSSVVMLEGRGDPAAGRAVDVLIGREGSGPNGTTASTDPAAAIPAGYAEVMGYRPVVIDVNGSPSLAKPDGSCSSPVHLTFDMEPTCKAHDLGYDLLRYAAAIGSPLGDWARPLIDQWWYAAMHTRCDLRYSGAGGLACHGQVLATEAIVNVNTWREGNGPPIEENPWRYLGALALLPVILLGSQRLRPAIAWPRKAGLQVAPALPAMSG